MKHMYCPKKRCGFSREKITTQIFGIIKQNIKPSLIEVDTFVLEDMMKNAHYAYVLVDYYPNILNMNNMNIKFIEPKNKISIFSWSMMILQLALLYRQYVDEWRRKIRKCPACGTKLKSSKVNDLNIITSFKSPTFPPLEPLDITHSINSLLDGQNDCVDFVDIANTKGIRNVQQIIKRMDKGITK